MVETKLENSFIDLLSWVDNDEKMFDLISECDTQQYSGGSPSGVQIYILSIFKTIFDGNNLTMRNLDKRLAEMECLRDMKEVSERASMLGLKEKNYDII